MAIEQNDIYNRFGFFCYDTLGCTTFDGLSAYQQRCSARGHNKIDQRVHVHHDQHYEVVDDEGVIIAVE